MPWFSRQPHTPPDVVRPPRIAIEIDGDDIRAIEQVVRHAERRRRARRLDLHLDRTGQELVSRLYQRVGASVAAGNDKTVPLFQDEIQQIRQAQNDIRCYAFSHDRMEDKAQELLNKLDAKLGYAKATTERGGVSVIVPQIPAAEVPA